jgi:O-antigen biosynthesis protein
LENRAGVALKTVRTWGAHSGEPRSVVGKTARARGSGGRPRVHGKSIYLGDDRLVVRGVTYGTFRPGAGGVPFPPPERAAEDFRTMAASGVDTVRTYTVPPLWLLDLAHAHDLRILAGLPWEQHVTFLDERDRRASIAQRVEESVRSCARHPALLAYAVGNEIPASIVRWHGHRRIERFLERLCERVRAADPGALVTYVNYPSTEYLELPFLDFLCFNVFLEADAAFESYVARLQNLAGNRPLVLTEIGLDSLRNGEDRQARTISRQVRTAFELGCAGAFVFAWTDEWHRGGHDVEDWGFGVVDRLRRPKPALAELERAFRDAVDPPGDALPRMSVVVCTYNGERWLGGCLDALARLEYPDYEVIVVDDGSTDRTAEVAAERPWVRLISTPNRGLSAARNCGMGAATGEIVAYVDDDARPDPAWLRQLARAFLAGRHAAVGGPNIAPPRDGFVADCVANAPGGPVHVLVSDREAEHLPGCNLAVRKASLEAIGGFDPTFRIAGDDVDVCWRLHERGETLGFSPGAIVWHHRRGSIRAYLRQQFQYGKAEALLERKWPDRYNRVGHLSWGGRIYGNALSTMLSWRRGRIRYGTWGRGLFQSREPQRPRVFTSLPLMPEWWLVITVLGLLAGAGALWRPLLAALPLLGLAAGATVVEAAAAAAHAWIPCRPPSRAARLLQLALIAALHVAQPPARLAGRIRHGLTLWRRRCPRRLRLPRRRTLSFWSEEWRDATTRLGEVQAAIRRVSPAVGPGGDYDRWDLQLRGGVFGVVRVLATVEEHGGGRQLVRFRAWPVPSRAAVGVATALAAVAVVAAAAGSTLATIALAGVAAVFGGWALHDCAAASGTLVQGLREHGERSATDLQLPATTPAASRSGERRSANGTGDVDRRLPREAIGERAA